MHKVNISTSGKTFSSIILILLFFFGQNIFGYFKQNYTSVFAEDNLFAIFINSPSLSKVITKLVKSRNSTNTKLIFFGKNLYIFAINLLLLRYFCKW